MSKKLKVFSKKLFGRKSKMGPEDNLFRGSTSGSIMRDEIMKHIDPTLVGQMISYEWCGAGVVEDLEGSGQEHHGDFTDNKGGEGDGSVAGLASRHRQFRRSHVVAPPIAPHTDNRVVIIPYGDG
jgi:hypothetical protein